MCNILNRKNDKMQLPSENLPAKRKPAEGEEHDGGKPLT